MKEMMKIKMFDHVTQWKRKDKINSATDKGQNTKKRLLGKCYNKQIYRSIHRSVKFGEF